MDDSTGGTSAVAEAPAAPSSAASAAPATPVTSTVSAERPTSFAEAMARVGETAPPHPGVPGDPPPAAIAPQTPTAPAVPSVDAKGPIPFDRHEAALKNARTKTEAEVGQRFQQQYAPHVELGNRFQADPIGTAVQVIRELSAHPEMGPLITSALARELGSRRGQQAPQTDQEPQADLQTADGTLVFSAEQLAKREAYQRQRLMQEVDQRLTPLQQREQQLAAQEQYRAATSAANDRMSKVLAPYQALPEFTEHKAEIAAKTQTFLGEGYDAQTALGLAVTTVLREVVMPARTAQSQQQLQAAAVAKSIGSTSAPGGAPAVPAGRPKNFADAFKRVSA